VRLIRCEWGAEKALREIYNRRPDEFDTKGDAFGGLRQRTKLDAIRRLLLAEKSANEAMRKRILSEEIVRARLQKIDEQLLRLEDD